MNVREFRGSIKDCLDRAEAGEVIKIERSGVIFYLGTADGMHDGQMRIVETAMKLGESISDHKRNSKSDGVIPMTAPQIEGMRIPPMQPPIQEQDMVVATPACCKQLRTCIHWQPDQMSENWINSISGEVRPILQ